jgi:hypothetical protein
VNGRLTAAVVARGSFDVVVGSSSGEVVVWRLDNNQIERVTSQGGQVDALATDAQGRVIVTMHCDGQSGQLRSYFVSHEGRFRYCAERIIQGGEESPRLLPIVRSDRGDFHVDVIDNDLLTHLRGPHLLPESDNPWLSWLNRPDHLLLMEAAGVWVWAERRIELALDRKRKRIGKTLGWQPSAPDGSPLSAPPIDWLNPESGKLEITGVSLNGAVYWSSIKAVGDNPEWETASLPAPEALTFRTSSFVAPGQFAAVASSNDVLWLRIVRNRLDTWAKVQRLPYPAKVAVAFARPSAGDLVLLFDDGMATRLPLPPARMHLGKD